MDALSSSSSFISSSPNLLNSSSYCKTTNLTIPSISAVQTDDHPTTRRTSKAPRRRLPAKPPAITRPPIQLPSLIFKVVDDIVNKFIDSPMKPSVDPRYVLSENFSPVPELPPTECEIEFGKIPECLHGAYIRNGPNPQYLPRGPYHMFDGDGMLHAIRMMEDRVTLCSRYVKTYKYVTERDIGAPVIPNVFSGFNGLVPSAARGAITAARMAVGQFNPANGIGLANTSLALFGGRLYALGESDLPYEVQVTKDGDVETIGRHDFNGDLFMSMTAHPKIDQDTGEAFGFRYGPAPPFLTYFYFDSKGQKQPDVPVFSLGRPSFIHDFAITKKYAIFVDIQIGMNPMEMILGGGSPVGSDPAKVPRIGIMPRYAKDESGIRWFEVPGFNIIHAINAWDEDDGDTVVLVAPNIISVEHTMERMDLIHAMVEKVRIDLKTKLVSRQPLSTRNLDFAVINYEYTGKRNNYVYAAVGDPMPKITGVVKLDITKGAREERTVACRMFGPRCYGGEPFFVAREPENAETEEDDGYVVSYVHDEERGESRFLVMDARSADLEVVASVKLPRRVPYGFHGLFVKESDLNKLNKL